MAPGNRPHTTLRRPSRRARVWQPNQLPPGVPQSHRAGVTRQGGSTPPVTATSTGAWLIASDYKYFMDKSLADNLGEVFRGSSVLELGAGRGNYVEYLRKTGKLRSIAGYDGVPNIVELTGGVVQYADLTIEGNPLPVADWVLCLEVAEHIPQAHEKTFLNYIINHSTTGVILSWGLPGQGGVGHVNLRSNDEVIAIMESAGYKLMGHTSQKLRVAARLGWFKKSVMAFRKGDAADDVQIANQMGRLNRDYSLPIFRSENHFLRPT